MNDRRSTRAKNPLRGVEVEGTVYGIGAVPGEQLSQVVAPTPECVSTSCEITPPRSNPNEQGYGWEPTVEVSST